MVDFLTQAPTELTGADMAGMGAILAGMIAFVLIVFRANGEDDTYWVGSDG